MNVHLQTKWFESRSHQGESKFLALSQNYKTCNYLIIIIIITIIQLTLVHMLLKIFHCLFCSTKNNVCTFSSLVFFNYLPTKFQNMTETKSFSWSVDFSHNFTKRIYSYLFTTVFYWRILDLNVGCVFAYFCGGHKSNFPIWFRSSLSHSYRIRRRVSTTLKNW